MSRKRLYGVLLIGTLLLLCCGLTMCTAGMLPRPDAEPAAWSAMAQVASTSRLMAFLIAMTGGQLGQLCLIPVIIALLLVVFRLARPGAGGWR